MQDRVDITRKAEFDLFLAWLLGKDSQTEIGTSGRSFRRHIAWCWWVEPIVAQSGVVHRQVMLDGTYFNGWCVLVAYTGTHVIDWQWCDKESTASWTALLERIAPPDIAIVDGNAALLSVMKQLWPATKVQRCLFHLRQGAHRHLTRRPNLEASKELLALFRALSGIKDLEQAAAWMGLYATWEAKWASFLKQRTYANRNNPRPSYVRASQKWWYTHIRLRRARGLLAEVVRNEHLFTWLSHCQPEETIARTTSPLEGGINAGIKELLRNHRGLSDDHARRAVDWYLYVHTNGHIPPAQLVQPHHWEPIAKPQIQRTQNSTRPAEYDTAFSTEEGIGIRKGWGGRY